MREKIKYRKEYVMCIICTGGKNVHHVHLNKVSEYCLVEDAYINSV